MNECRSCDLAVYCYSEPCSWVFRTMEEMCRKQERIVSCPIRQHKDEGKKTLAPGTDRGGTYVPT